MQQHHAAGGVSARLLIITLTLMLSGINAQTTIYASPTGSSSNSGTEGSPWDITTACNNLAAGTTLNLLPGTYTITSQIDIEAAGTSSQPITIQGNGQAILNGSSLTGSSDILQLTRYSAGAPYDIYFTIDGVKFFNAARAGLRLSWVNYVTVKNIESGYNGVWGIFTDFSNYLTIQNVDCHHSGTQHGIYISNSCGNELVENSKFHDNGGAGIHHNGDASSGDGQSGYVTGEIVNTTIRNNLIYGNGQLGGSAINLDGVRESFIYNNVIYNNVAGGIVNFAQDGVNPGNNVIIHNTIHFSSTAGRYGIGIHGGSSGNTIGNNILITAAVNKYAIDLEGAGSNNNIDYNAVFVPDANNFTFTLDGSVGVTPQEFAAAGYGSHIIVLPDADSTFRDVNNADFREVMNALTVQAGSIDFSMVKGSVVADILGVPRKAGNVDIGAYNFYNQGGDGGGGSSSPASPRAVSELLRTLKKLI